MNVEASQIYFSPLSYVAAARLVVSQELSKMVEISSAFAEKPSTEKMHAIVQLAAQPIIAGEGKLRRIERAADRLGLGLRRAKSHWYAEAKQVKADELDHARRQAADIAATLHKQVVALENIDADFYRPQIDATRNMLVRAGFVFGAGTETGSADK